MNATAPVAATPMPHVRTQRGSPSFSIPNLVFENQSHLDATEFDAVDQFSASFHVVVARSSYTFSARDAADIAVLKACTPPGKLNVEDRHVDDDSNASVLQESDFAPYKPACDVILNATAYAPRGKPVSNFCVGLTVRAAPGQAPATPLIDKTLNVSGERGFQKRFVLTRILQWTALIATLGLWRPSPWRLQAPDKMTSMPLRYEFAYGGQCRINAGEVAARRVPKSQRIASHETRLDDADAGSNAVAHESNDANPLGRGFARGWYLSAARVRAIPAPRFSAVRQPVSARQFWRGVKGHDLPAPTGFGVVGRGWLPRRALAGTFIDKAEWGADEVPMLPDDFDFAYYNGAPLAQQCPYLAGQEEITLTNLCRHDHPAATLDENGNTLLRFILPRQVLVVLAADAAGGLLVKRMVIDTVIIDPDAGQLDLVWRVLLPTQAV